MKKALILALCLAMIAACRSTFYETKETPSMTRTPQYSIEDVERIARIKIPADAFEVQVYAVTGWMDDAALIRFKLPPDELQPFLDEYGFSELESGYWSIQNAPPSVTWWPTSDLSSKPPISAYLGGELDFPGYSQSILVDVSDPDVYVVYFQCFEH